MQDSPRRIALVGSGTAGHVSPALAIAQAYQQAFLDTELLFIGAQTGTETHIIPPLGYRLELIPAAPLFGVGLIGKLRAIRSVLTGFRYARRLLRGYQVKLVIGMGGYTSGAVLLAAWSLGLRTVIHEANAVPGTTNHLLRRFVDRVYVGFAEAGRFFPPGKTVVAGTPVRPEIVASATVDRVAPMNRPARILITGGSQGSSFLNDRVPELLKAIATREVVLEIRHQAGGFRLGPVQIAYEKAGLSAGVTHSIADMADAYGWADFAIAGAGAITLAELAVMGLPALIVPVAGTADDHQTKNARAAAQARDGWWVSEADWHCDSLAGQLGTLLSDPQAWRAASDRMKQSAIPGAAQAVVADCEALLAGRW